MRYLIKMLIGFCVLNVGLVWLMYLVKNQLTDTWLGFLAGFIIGVGYIIGANARK